MFPLKQCLSWESTLINILVEITARFSVCYVCVLHYNTSYITFDLESRPETGYHSWNKNFTFHVYLLEEWFLWFFSIRNCSWSSGGKRTPRSIFFLEQPTVAQLVKELPALLSNPMERAVFTTRHWMVYCARLIQSCSKAGLKFDSI